MERIKRKDKRELARKLAKLEKKRLKASSDEEKTNIETQISDIITDFLIATDSNDPTIMSAFEYIDDYIQENIGSKKEPV